MWHTYSRCCKKPLPDGWNFAWWWSQMQDVSFTWNWWLFCTADEFRKHAGTGKLVCLVMVCFRSAQTHKYLFITDQITWWLVVWGGGQGSKSGSTVHIPPSSFLYKNIVLWIETLIKFYGWAKWTVRSIKGIHNKKGDGIRMTIEQILLNAYIVFLKE